MFIISKTGLKKQCYSQYCYFFILILFFLVKTKKFQSNWVITSASMYQASFDYLGSNYLYVDSQGLKIKSKHNFLEKTIVQNNNNTYVSLFKVYPNIG